MTSLHEVRTLTDADRFRDLYATLDDHEKSMFNQLQKDAALVKPRPKAILKVLQRKQQLRFAIVREGCPLPDGIKVSNLVLEKDKVLTRETISKLMSLLKLSGYLIELEPCERDIRDGINYSHYRYSIDLKVAA